MCWVLFCVVLLCKSVDGSQRNKNIFFFSKNFHRGFRMQKNVIFVALDINF